MVHKLKKSSQENWGGTFETKSGEIIEVPEFMQILDKNRVKVKTSDFEGSHINVITRGDVEDYFKEGFSMSGMRVLGTYPNRISGDWRMIDSLAEEIKYIFDKLKESV